MLDSNPPLADQACENWQVLIIDDEADNRMVAKSVLEFHGATAYTASSAAEGLKQLQKHPINLLLLDLAMPGTTGWELLEQLQQDETRSQLPVIAITARAMPGDRERVLSAGFNGYIPKPYDATTLTEQIRQALRTPATETVDKIDSN